MSRGGTSKAGSSDTNADIIIVTERVTKFGQEPQLKKYKQGKFLGKGGFARCYEFQHCEEMMIGGGG